MVYAVVIIQNWAEGETYNFFKKNQNCTQDYFNGILLSHVKIQTVIGTNEICFLEWNPLLHHIVHVRHYSNIEFLACQIKLK